MWNTFRKMYSAKYKKVQKRSIIKGRQRGSATVEAIVAFVGFLFVIFTILNVVNFCRAQVLISNAVDAVTKELTQYSYLYQISGLQKFDSDIQDIAQTGKDNLNTVAESVGDLYSAMSDAYETTSREATNLANATLDGSVTEDMVTSALNHLEMDGTNINTSINNMTTEFATVADNPVLYMKSIIAVAGSEGLEAIKSHLIAAPLAKAMLVKHFGSDWDSADQQLKALGVVDGLGGMNFGMSTMFSANEKEDIHIVVYYKLKITQFFPWADFEATMCKQSRARAWLGGDDVIVKVAVAKSDSGDVGGENNGAEPPEQTEENTGGEEPPEQTEENTGGEEPPEQTDENVDEEAKLPLIPEEDNPEDAEIKRLDEINVEFSWNPKHDKDEFARQLADQEKGMNELTVQEYLDNRERYKKSGRAPEGNAAQQAAREEAYLEKVTELRNSGLSEEEAKAQATEWLKTQAALHNPDQIAGGYADRIGGVGDSGVNSSIGSQWRSRIKDVDKIIEEMAKNMTEEERKTTYLNVRLIF